MAKRTIHQIAENVQAMLAKAHDPRAVAALAARGIFDDALGGDVGFEAALGEIYLRAIRDWEASKPQRKRRKAKANGDAPPEEC